MALRISGVLGAIICTASAADDPTPTFVTTSVGRLQGYIDPTHQMRAFRGIPYAKPPLGDLRLRSPKAFGPWSGTRDATTFGSTCLQNPSGGWKTIEGRGNTSEDCLFLNVVAPESSADLSAKKLYPVVVYFHAGEFDYGAASDRESDWPFARDVVLVAPNSRLGLLGYMGSEELRSRTDDGSTGNLGVADQRLALEWVRDNIAAFGGNASNVLIMGESSGGTSVAAHLATPASWGLFHKAVLESPGLTQTKTLADAHTNFMYIRDALAAHHSPGCVRASPGTYNNYSNAIGSSRHVLGGGDGWNYTHAAAVCDANPDCTGFSILQTPRHFLQPARDQVRLYASPELFAGGYLHLPAGANLSTYLKAAAGGEAGVSCILRANGTMMMQIGEMLPRADDFFTDSWAPVVDGVALPQSIVSAFDAGKLAPGVSVLAGSNMDEGTIFMGLTPRIDCRASDSVLAEWSTQFYGEAVGGRIPHLYSTLREPIPICDHHTAAAAAGPRARLSAALSATASEWGLTDEPSRHPIVEDPSAVPPPPSASSPPPPPAYSAYMAAMRSAGDYAITCRVRAAAATLAAKGQAVYTYYFAHTPKYSANYEHTASIGAFHGAEVPFVFNDAFELTTDGERALSKAMGCYWRNFAHTADPNRGPCATSEQPTSWPRFKATPHAQEATMVLDVGAIDVEYDLKKAQCNVLLGTR